MCSLCWHNSTSFFNLMSNIFIFSCTDPKTYLWWLLFCRPATRNNSPDYPYDKKLCCLCLTYHKKVMVYLLVFAIWEIRSSLLVKNTVNSFKCRKILNLTMKSVTWNSLLKVDVLTHFMPLVSFYTPSKHQKTSGFLTFSGGIERDQWHEMG